MIVLKRKNRVLTLRISDEDYQVLRQASLANGARSLSDYARDSLFRRSPRPTPLPADKLQTRMDEFAVELDSLNHALRELHRLIEPRHGEAGPA